MAKTNLKAKKTGSRVTKQRVTSSRIGGSHVTKQRESHVKSLRLLQLEKAIQTLTYPDVERLMKELEVSRRTILRNIDELRLYYNAPIEYSREHKGYYYTDETFFVKNFLLSEGELVALVGILPLLARYDNTPLKDTIVKVYNTISEMLPTQIKVQSSLLNDVEFISDPIPNIDSDVFTKIFEAIRTHHAISFDYRSISQTNHHPHYGVEPYKIYCQKGDWYVVAFSQKNQRFNTYTLSRMKNIEFLDQFNPDPDYEKKVYIDPYFGIWNNAEKQKKIELLFDKSVNTYILERTWHKNQKCSQKKDGSVYLSFQSNQIQETLYWVLRFGTAVKILNPPELKEMYKAEVKKMVKGIK